MQESGIFKGEDDENIYVFFGGKIAVGIGSYDESDKENCPRGVAFMELAELKKYMPIGTSEFDANIEQLNDKPTVKLIFNKTESIDAMIDKLNEMKKRIKQ